MTRREQILDVAEQILTADKYGSLSMRAIAARVQMQVPSLYKHVAGKSDIEAGLQERALVALGRDMADVPSRLPEVATAYRAWALSHPQLYELATRRRLRRGGMDPQAEALAIAPILTAVNGDRNLARGLWALAHGMVDLELTGRLTPAADLEVVWRSIFSAVTVNTGAATGGDQSPGRSEKAAPMKRGTP